MSYILEALRRAEIERQRGAVPGLHAQPLQGALADSAPGGPDDAGRRWRWPLLIGLLAVLLGLAAGLGWWLKPATEVVRLAGMPAPALARPDRLTQPTAVEPPVPIAVAPPVPIAVPMPVPAPVQAPLQTPLQTPPVTAPSVQAMPVKPRVAAAPTPPDPPTSPAVSKAAPPAGLAQRAPLLPAQPPASEARLPTLAELPEALRREVQPLSLGGLVYAEQPALRIAIVNGQVFHEGDKPLPDLLVQQIRPKSVVFGFRGQRFELAQ